MKITAHEVEHVARLARLKTSPEDVARLTDQMNQILTYMEKLGELDTSDIEPTAHPLALSTPYRDDVARPSLDSETALANAPDRDEHFFRVPKVI